MEIADRFEIEFVEIGTDEDHIHFLVQSVPTMSVDRIIRTIKSITAREIFHRFPKVKKDCGVEISGRVDTMRILLVTMVMLK